MLNSNKTRSILLAMLAFLGIICQFYCSGPAAKAEEPAKKELSKEEMVAKGDYLVTVGGCNHCHSPKAMTPMGPVPDTSKLLSGHPGGLPPISYDATKPGSWVLMAPDLTAAVGPWGISFAANLTPDSATGIGAWTKEVFIKTLRTGKHLGQEEGRPILPPMPWDDLAKMTDEDLGAIYAYLHSLPPVRNQVPPPVPPTEVGK